MPIRKVLITPMQMKEKLVRLIHKEGRASKKGRNRYCGSFNTKSDVLNCTASVLKWYSSGRV